MARSAMLQRDKRRKKLTRKQKSTRKELKSIIKDVTVPFEEKALVVLKLNKLKRDTSAVRLNRRCTCCGRPKAVYRKFALCRMCLRKLAMAGFLPGVLKASW